MLEVIPVLDLMNSMAVSGKSGNRDTYTPLNSIFASNSDPISLANNLKFNGAKQIYIADLDLIEKRGHNLDKIKMINTVLPVMLDSGIRNLESFDFFLKFANKLIVASETLESIEELYKIFDKYPKERIIVSVDIKNGELLSNFEVSLDDFKKDLIEIDPDEIILLDISNVGTKKGFNTELLNEFSEFKDKLILGGGINKEEIPNIEKFGINKALVGSALHNGEIRII
ncbi:phosphoribosylformimino-5-aminoimidazole carboxamide ribotide isomerase [Methanobrevibacter arboriphilus]|jgi:phosphoribosylformimino-5-aminoimidazole carboxamide ribotide isomerase|uniref:Phosphoribosylformimino-5-aminoimidazole carboxamide ribotide isomerase n=1 Tax=Methanobrevibacter arboriphilus TaxID=39441 RepID=A0ACA8R1C3_METAZ|nr:HisA/HisF family protein [Methanobrevibacter arboriphilus]MCC7562594.1 HisA/HisF family protein [Methanobrevibacter arboriphilus]BBL61252.1 phosphoribosylformimino-5-aminoimidazole carboxamide ribotide isomerase [Methanobrevibacter arboriphilus]GLI11415.1 phosphoribosylformimino-5-aminoimidazole carboxamide ribotide isomerase [Methanobrevibacter arboriphilus]